MRHFDRSLLLGVLFVALMNQSSAQRKYAVIDMGSFTPTGINDRGQVSGYRIAGSITIPLRWDNGVITDYPRLSANSAIATGINSAGQMSGYAVDLTPRPRAVRFGVTPSITQVISPGSEGSQGNAINDNGFIAGSVDLISPSETHVARWMAGDSLQDLGTFKEHGATGRGMNNLGDVVGDGEAPPVGQEHALVSFNGAPIIDLHNTSNLGGNRSEGYDINNLRHIVGMARLSTGTNHAVMWRNNVITDLHTFPTGSSDARAVNDSDQVVGNSSGGPFFWEDGVMMDLNDMIDSSSGWVLQNATGISNTGRIIGSGLHNGQLRAYMLDPFLVIEPHAGDLWIAGEQDTIRWSAPAGLQLRIEFSDSDGASYSTVATNVPSDSNKYVWQIPQAFSRKCRIKLIDIADESTYVVSERFKVKGYQLTRLRTDSSYEAFRPDLHGWRFLNTADTMWPASWWSQFNYQSGLDPYTNELYPDEDPFASAFSEDFVDWPLFVKSFLPTRCYLSLNPPVYSPSAATYWGETTNPYGGSCDGFSISSLLAFVFEEAFLDSFPSIGTYVNLYDLPVNDERRKVINQLWEYQFGVEHLDYVRPRQTGVSPRQTLADLKDMLMKDTGNYRYLRAIDQTSPRVHALVPYKLERDTFFPDFYNVFVYDCNRPGDTSIYVVIDSAADSWEYLASGYSGTKGLFLMEPVSGFLPHPTLTASPSLAGSSGVNFLQVLTTTSASIAITNQAGQTIGFQDSSVTNTFSEGIPILPPTSRYQPPIGYFIPFEKYSILLRDLTDSLVHTSIFADSAVYIYRRHDALSSQTDRLTFEIAGIGLQNPDAQSKPAEFKMIIKEENSEKVFSVGSYVLNQDDSSFYGAINHDHLRLVNTGSQKQYILTLTKAATSGQSRFLHVGVDIPANSSQEIAPTWTDLRIPVAVYIDIGNNGTVDDTMFVGNTLDVDNGGTPGVPIEFGLSQNYPNPFNPATSIKFQVPSSKLVSLKVYDVLGREVATLVDEVKTPGEYTVHWNATGFASGVYFYRLSTNGSAQTRKLVLLR